jgi:hypothetical protein
VPDSVQTRGTRNDGLVSELGYGFVGPQDARLPKEPSGGNRNLASGGGQEQGWLAATGAQPVNHTLVVSEDLLAASPGLAEEIFAWFAESERLGREPGTWPADRASYGLTAANRTSLDVLLRLTKEQLPGESGLGDSVDNYFLPIGS